MRYNDTDFKGSKKANKAKICDKSEILTLIVWNENINSNNLQ